MVSILHFAEFIISDLFHRFRFIQNYCLGLWMDEMEHGENSTSALNDYFFSVASVLVALVLLTIVQMASSLSAAQVSC